MLTSQNIPRVPETDKERIISLLLHDLRPPLHTLKFLTSFLSDNSHTMPPDQLRAYSKELHMAVQDLVQSSSAIFTWLEVQRRRYVPVATTIGLEALLLGANEHFEQESGTNAAHISCAAPENAVAFTDSQAVITVVHQLLRNAAAQKPGGTILLKAWRQAHNTCVSVSDEGNGMSDRVAANIVAHLHGEEGDELYRYGYRIIIRVLHLLGGAIHFDKAKTGGAEITVTFPDLAPGTTPK